MKEKFYQELELLLDTYKYQKENDNWIRLLDKTIPGRTLIINGQTYKDKDQSYKIKNQIKHIGEVSESANDEWVEKYSELELTIYQDDIEVNKQIIIICYEDWDELTNIFNNIENMF